MKRGWAVLQRQGSTSSYFPFSLTSSSTALTIKYTVKMKNKSFCSNPLQRKLGLLPQYASLLSLKTTTTKFHSCLLLPLRSLRVLDSKYFWNVKKRWGECVQVQHYLYLSNSCSQSECTTWKQNFLLAWCLVQNGRGKEGETPLECSVSHSCCTYLQSAGYVSVTQGA